MNHPTLFPTEAEVAASQPRLCWVCTSMVVPKAAGCDRHCLERTP